MSSWFKVIQRYSILVFLTAVLPSQLYSQILTSEKLDFRGTFSDVVRLMLKRPIGGTYAQQ